MALRSVGENCVERGWEDRGENHLCEWVPAAPARLCFILLWPLLTLCVCLGLPLARARERITILSSSETLFIRGATQMYTMGLCL